MKLIAAVFASLIVAGPANAASLAESRMSGVITGQAMCSLKRHGAPVQVMREEFARLTKTATNADILDLTRYGQAYLEVIEQMMQICPERGLPDA